MINNLLHIDRYGLPCRFQKFAALGLSVCLLFLGNSLSAQDCSVEIAHSMACNNLVNVSIGTGCTTEITPSIMTENLPYSDESYAIEITDINNIILDDDLVKSDFHEQNFSVKVTHICSGSNCWGYIYVEDKIGPPLVCQTDTVECTLTSPADFGFPVPETATVFFNDDGSYFVETGSECDDFVLNYREKIEDLGCDGNYSQIIERIWQAEDLNGNTSTCIDTIYVRPGDLTMITLPPHYDNLDQPAFECHDILDTLPNGHPSPEETGFLVGSNCTNLVTYYEDLEFEELCGASKKILRSWTVINWCNGEELSYDQVIKVMDLTNPIIEGINDTIVNTNHGACYAQFQVPLPIVDDCSEWTYTIKHKIVSEYSDPYTDATIDYVKYNEITNRYTITELPFGKSWITVYVEDDCGYDSDIFFMVDVVDNQLPNPICDGHTVLSLDNNNSAKLYASSLNDGSIDNCALVNLDVRRMADKCDLAGNTLFGEFVEFCCADVGDVHQVSLRAEDRSGNVNQCMIEVRIEDELGPLFKYCPKDIIIDCEVDYLDLDSTGIAEAYDNCNFELSFIDWPTLNTCGLGTVKRTWTATDDSGNSNTCKQEITIQSDDFISEANIYWPKDSQVSGCIYNTFEPSYTGEPKVTNNGCARIWIDYTDEVFYGLNNQCSKILRTWNVRNECTDWYSYNEFSYIQAIKVNENEAPVFLNCQDTLIVLDGNDCINEVALLFAATDNCTPDASIYYNYQIDENQDGIVDVNGSGNNLMEDFSFGTADITINAIDKCGNIGTCEFTLTVKDDKAPTPVCIPVSWSLGAEGEVEIWAADINLKSFDNCTAEEDLILSFSEDPSETFRIFSCDQIPNGIGYKVPVTLYVFDGSGNFDYCDTHIQIIDSNNKCEDVGNLSATLGGTIMTEEGQSVKEVDIIVENGEFVKVMESHTNDEGSYQAEGLSLLQDLIIQPEKNNDFTNGVTTLDLVLIQKHILGVKNLDSPYKMIAADINASGSISASDLIELRKVILGLKSEFSSNKSWRFTDMNYTFMDASAPWIFPETIQLKKILSDQMHNDFIGIKIGDVNASASSSDNQSVKVRASAKLIIDAEQMYRSNNEVLLPIYIDKISSLEGFQFSMSSKVNKIEGIISGTLDIDAESYAFNQQELSLSWTSPNGAVQVNKGEALFYIVFSSDGFKEITAGSIELNKQMQAEVYSDQLEAVSLELILRSSEKSIEYPAESAIKMYQNSPNPFELSTQIIIESPSVEDVLLEVVDINGAKVLAQKLSLSIGTNKIDISDTGQWTSGLYIYSVKGEQILLTQKMIKK